MPLLHDVAHLGHAELLTPEPEKSLWFFSEVLGLTRNGASGASVYLRTWDDYEHHSLKLTASATSGIRRTGLRAASPEALMRRVADIEAAGLALGWRDGVVCSRAHQGAGLGAANDPVLPYSRHPAV